LCEPTLPGNVRFVWLSEQFAIQFESRITAQNETVDRLIIDSRIDYCFSFGARQQLNKRGAIEGAGCGGSDRFFIHSRRQQHWIHTGRAQSREACR
jgi:hypothetical protein